MVEFLFLDLDDTILDFHKAEAVALSKTLTDFGISPTEENLRTYSAINKAHWERLERREITRSELQVSRFVTFLSVIGADVPGEAVARAYEENLSHGHYFLPGAKEALDALRDRYRMFLLSNGNAKVQDGRLASAGILPYFENVFISERVGADKPSKEFFDRCTAQIPGYAPEKALMVGDSLTSDILGGKNAGIPTCWMNPARKTAGNIHPDYEIGSLSELPGLLEGL